MLQCPCVSFLFKIHKNRGFEVEVACVKCVTAMSLVSMTDPPVRVTFEYVVVPPPCDM